MNNFTSSSNLWRNKRLQQDCLQIWKNIDRGIYAIVLRKTQSDESIDISSQKWSEEQINTDLTKCIEQLEELLQNNQTSASIYLSNKFDSNDFEQRLRQSITELNRLQNEKEITKQTETVKSFLKDIEKHSKRVVRS